MLEDICRCRVKVTVAFCFALHHTEAAAIEIFCPLAQICHTLQCDRTRMWAFQRLLLFLMT